MSVANRNNLEFVRNLLSVLLEALTGNPVVALCETSVFYSPFFTDVAFTFDVLLNNAWFVLWLQRWFKPVLQFLVSSQLVRAVLDCGLSTAVFADSV